MTKKEEQDFEQRLLSRTSLDALIKMKMEEEMKVQIESSKQKPEKSILTEISEVPANLIFSKKAVFRLFNRNNKNETFINGLQAEALLGTQNSTREKIKRGEMDAFSTETTYVKFEKIEF